MFKKFLISQTIENFNPSPFVKLGNGMNDTVVFTLITINFKER